MNPQSAATSADKLVVVNPRTLFDPTPFGYSQAVIAPSQARIAHISGQGGADAEGMLSPDFATQVGQAFANLRAVLASLGAEAGQVAKLTLFVVDHDPSKLGILTACVVETFGVTLPAQTLLAVPRLALDGMLFEVEAVVALD